MTRPAVPKNGGEVYQWPAAVVSTSCIQPAGTGRGGLTRPVDAIPHRRDGRLRGAEPVAA
jgi:hypothetical protein